MEFVAKARRQASRQARFGPRNEPVEGISIAQFLTVGDIERSARYYEKVFGARILSLRDGNAPGYLQLANILNVGGGPTPDKPAVTLSVPDPNHINSFMNFRVADIQACYELWKSRGAEFITPPIPKYARFAATSAILTAMSSRWDRAPTSSTVRCRRRWDSDLNGREYQRRESLRERLDPDGVCHEPVTFPLGINDDAVSPLNVLFGNSCTGLGELSL